MPQIQGRSLPKMKQSQMPNKILQHAFNLHLLLIVVVEVFLRVCDLELVH